MISFICPKNLKGVIPEPVPAKKAIPQWLAKMESFLPSDTAMKGETVKKCMPFLDAMTAGYIIPLWSDVAYKATDDNLNLSWRDSIFGNGNESLFDNHGGNQIKGAPIADQTPFGMQPMKFKNPWVIETDPGVSCLFTSPINHFQDLFHLMTGMVDTDTYFNNVNFPFLWMKPNCAGTLKKGMPLVQVVPIRRTGTGNGLTVREADEDDDLRRERVNRQLGTHLYDGYRTEYRHKRGEDQASGE